MDNEPEDEREGMRILRPDDDDPGLPHWTEPGTGQIPLVDDADDELAAWSSLSNSGPRWRDDLDEPAPVGPLTPQSQSEIPVIGNAAEDDFFGYDSAGAPPPGRGREAAQPARAARTTTTRSQPADLAQRVGTALGLAAVAILCLLIGKAVTLLLIAAILGVAASEFYVTLRRVGYQPVTLLGLTAVVAMPLSVYWRGESGIGVVLFLTMLFGVLWYLVGVQDERPVPNLGITFLGVVYIGVLGSFAALLLDTTDGIGLLLTAILLAVAYDVGGYFVGRAMGRSPLTETSPNKTVEGLIGGMVATVVVAFGIAIIGIEPFGGDVFGTLDTLLVGLAVAVVAPIGDLAESLMKRDLKVKDMGTILPGHGGLLDRFDALLFVLPTVYYTVRILA